MSDKEEVYLDTSVLAKWYLNEVNSEKVSQYIVNLESAAISTLTKVEMRSLLARRKRMQEIDLALEVKIFSTFLEDISQSYLRLHAVENKHIESSIHLMDIFPDLPLRTLDAIHLSIVQHSSIKRIATADKVFAEVGKLLGLEVDGFF